MISSIMPSCINFLDIHIIKTHINAHNLNNKICSSQVRIFNVSA